MKTLLLTTMLSTLLSNGTHTTSQAMLKTLPEKCPSVSSISSQGLDHVIPLHSPFVFPFPDEQLKHWLWVGIKENSHYDTNDSWTVHTIGEGDKNGRMAIHQLSKHMSSMQFEEGPERDKDTGLVVCVYKYDDEDLFSMTMAFSPALYN